MRVEPKIVCPVRGGVTKTRAHVGVTLTDATENYAKRLIIVRTFLVLNILVSKMLILDALECVERSWRLVGQISWKFRRNPTSWCPVMTSPQKKQSTIKKATTISM